MKKHQKKIITLVLIWSLLFTGCSTWEIIETPEPDSHIKITTQNYEVFEMPSWSEEGEYIVGDAGETKREGRTTLKVKTRIYKNDIYQYEEKKFDVLNTAILLVGTAALAVVIAVGSSDFWK
jgi:hypothetical protein